MSLIKPSIGRVVWYWPTQSEKTGAGVDLPSVSASNDQPLAATVACVHSDKMVNLSVVDANGRQYSRTSVSLLQEGDVRPENGGFAEWMPYQISQAAKEAEKVTESAGENDEELGSEE
ncbi:hypothetical protein QZJ86_12195 [Methylomonas montana]|uniref:hypothetical protein n=1 Tax=Methylomonas montana TaxID=3058963 RepID=UPI00265A288A|nr:hypothetical protein [Methylomonas montana]WKJ88783.1 hypothetical protein QZJ86_12195 [Methylomonas montana]